MKKQYISPLTHIVRVETTHLCTPSVTRVTGTDHDIDLDGEAEENTGSDSRRRNVWDDEEEDYY